MMIVSHYMLVKTCMCNQPAVGARSRQPRHASFVDTGGYYANFWTGPWLERTEKAGFQSKLGRRRIAMSKEGTQTQDVPEPSREEKEPDEEEFQADNEKTQKAVTYLMTQKTIGVWTVQKIIGAGANGIVSRVIHETTKKTSVMKVALSATSAQSLVWESEVMARILATEGEDRTQHLVRRLGGGLTKGPEGEPLPYVVMENLPGNPVSIIGSCIGDELVSKVCEYGLQLLKAIYDLHKCGFIHRDIKPENLGLYNNEILVLYDLGMARAFTDKHGRHREPRSNIGMRGTDEWASVNAELGRDQGPIDDLWGWFYVMVEWMNCTSRTPLAWAAFDDRPHIRHFLKSSMFTSRLVLRGCPLEFFKIQAYLRVLNRGDSPDYFFLATLLLKAKKRADSNQNDEIVDVSKPQRQGEVVSGNKEDAMDIIVGRLNREEVLFTVIN
uniref:Protein kinase domain-containing protein n=1 Tax=Panagrellus redivivus TaxID=6233 RepID=A0A7E4V1I3_PANRE